MQAFVELGGLLLLLDFLIWMSSGQRPVLVKCSHFNFCAIAKRALFYQDEFIGPNELFLGTGCQAIQVRPDELEFDYPLSPCGIETQSTPFYGPRNYTLPTDFTHPFIYKIWKL